MLIYKIANEFTDSPGGRYRKLGDYSGEEFREVLIDLLKEHEGIKIILDDTEGYPSSFLEECFGGLVRAGFTAVDLERRIKFVASDPSFKFYISEIQEYINDAEKAA